MSTKRGVRAIAAALVLALCASAQVGTHKPSAAQKREALLVLSKAAPNVHWDGEAVVVGDIACDGRADQAFFGHADGKVFVGLFRARTRKPQVLEFRVSGGYQDAICQEPATLTLEPLDYEGDQVEGFRKSNTCQGLVLDDDACDPVHFYWDHAAHALNWWRN